MRRIKSLVTILSFIALAACIKPYTPNIEGEETSKLVVSGKVTSIEGWQEVNVSLASTVAEAAYNPVSGCEVNIYDNFGNIYAAEESDPGSYKAWITADHLVPGTAYMVSVVTPSGERIESAYDTLTAGSSLGNVYYELEDVPTNDPDVFIRGMQFYVDLEAGEADSRFYRWAVKETWEFHSAHALEYYYDGKFHEVIPPDYSLSVCWANIWIKNVYLVSTKNYSQNISLKNPLQFVDGSTSRLSVLYSILVSQQSLTESTYNYFEVVKKNSGGFGGLYEQQPFSLKGNLLNLSHPEKDVLGYFYACSESSRRYFYQDVEGLVLDYWDNCNEYPLPISGWLGFKKYQYPVYYFYTESGALRILSDECVDCRMRGGSITKPDFWP